MIELNKAENAMNSLNQETMIIVSWLNLFKTQFFRFWNNFIAILSGAFFGQIKSLNKILNNSKKNYLVCLDPSSLMVTVD